MAVIVGVDPSMSNTALVAFELTESGLRYLDSVLIGTKKTTKKQVRASSDCVERCSHLYEGAKAFVAKHNPDVIFGETPSGSQSSSGAKSYGISCFLLATLEPSVIEVTPDEVKMLTVGRKSASKRDIINWLWKKHPDMDWKIRGGEPQANEEHKADAGAAVYAGMQTPEFKRIRHMLK